MRTQMRTMHVAQKKAEAARTGTGARLERWCRPLAASRPETRRRCKCLWEVFRWIKPGALSTSTNHRYRGSTSIVAGPSTSLASSCPCCLMSTAATTPPARTCRLERLSHDVQAARQSGGRVHYGRPRTSGTGVALDETVALHEAEDGSARSTQFTSVMRWCVNQFNVEFDSSVTFAGFSERIT